MRGHILLGEESAEGKKRYGRKDSPHKFVYLSSVKIQKFFDTAMSGLPKLNFPAIRLRARRRGDGVEVWDSCGAFISC